MRYSSRYAHVVAAVSVVMFCNLVDFGQLTPPIVARQPVGLVATVAFGLSQAAAGSPTQANYQWRFGHVNSVTNHFQDLAVKFAELLEKKTNGRVKITIYPASQLGGEGAMFQQIKGGALEFGIHGTPGLAALGVKEAMAFDLPYMVSTREQGWKLVNGEFGDWFRELVRSKTGVKPLGFMDIGFRQVANRHRLIEKPEDLKGLKLRVLPAPGYVIAYEAFGAKPTPMAWPEVYQALQMGVIDGLEQTPSTMVSDKMIEVAKYYSFTSITYNPALLIAGDKFYQDLPTDIKKAIEESAKEALAFHSQLVRKRDEEDVEVMRQAGVKINEPNLTPFIKVVRPSVWDKLQSQIPDGKQVVERLLKAVEASK